MIELMLTAVAIVSFGLAIFLGTSKPGKKRLR
jgi:hypothetical protein